MKKDCGRRRLELAGYWAGTLTLNPNLDVAAPAVIEQDFYLPLPWNLQIETLKWPHPDQELSGVVRPVQNQNFREWQRKFAEGIIVLRRTLALQPDPGQRVFLVFEGSNFQTRAKVNGRDVGCHDGGHLGFEFEITDAVREGANEFEITVDNLRRKLACPQEQFNWQNYGGIYRNFYLEFRPQTFIQSVRITPGHDADGWFADFAIALNTTTDGLLKLTIESGAATETLEKSPGGKAWQGRIRMHGPLKIWQPGKGGMSTFHARLCMEGESTDEVSGSFGFRTVEVREHRVWINGEPIRILGAAWHEQHPVFGNALPGWQAHRDIQLMKQCGLNTIRAAHYPYSHAFYHACDREGMLCLAELPCWQFTAEQFASPELLSTCRKMAGEMVAQRGNHPAIIGWIVQNESATFEPGALPFFSAISRVFKEKDPSRFTLGAESPAPPEHLAVVKKAKSLPETPPPTQACVDMLGLNDYSGWYGEKADFLPCLLDRTHALLPDKPLIMTEFGAEGILGQRNLAMPSWSEDYQAELICRQIREILSRPYMAGFIIWLFMDYEPSSISIRGMNSKGLVDEFRRPKLAFNQVRQLLEGCKDEGKE